MGDRPKPRVTLTLDVAGWKLTLAARLDRESTQTALASRTDRAPRVRTGFRSAREQAVT